MATVATRRQCWQCGAELPGAGAQPSAEGGLVLAAKAWAMVWQGRGLPAGLRWQGKGGAAALFALVAVPLVLRHPSVLAVAQHCGELTDPLWQALAWTERITQRRLARFLASRRHDWLGVQEAMLRRLVCQPSTAPEADSVIGVDSTTVEKRYGPLLAGRRPVYDAITGGLVDGYEIVSACVAGATHWLPIGLVPHRKADAAADRQAQRRRRRKATATELPSKLDLTLRLVLGAVAAGVASPTVVADSAFCVMWWLREIAALPRHWLVGTRQDRRLRIGADIRRFQDWVQTAPVAPVATNAAGSGIWGVALAEATLLDKGCRKKGLACRPVYLERRDHAGHVRHRWYLLTSQRTWDVASVWQHWQWRWPIEVLHRHSKQELALASFHVRTWEGIVGLIACCSLRASLVCFLRAADPVLGAYAMPALVSALRTAACLVQPAAAGTVTVGLPPSLPATTLWRQDVPLPAGWEAVTLEVA